MRPSDDEFFIKAPSGDIRAREEPFARPPKPDAAKTGSARFQPISPEPSTEPGNFSLSHTTAVTSSSGGFELRGEDGEETRLLVHAERGYSIAVAGRPRVGTTTGEGPRYDIVLKMDDVPVELGFRMDAVETQIEAPQLVPALTLAYAQSRASNPEQISPNTLVGKMLAPGATAGGHVVYPLRGEDDAMEYVAITGKQDAGVVHALHMTVRYRKSDVTPFAWSNLRPALMFHQSWTAAKSPSMQVWPVTSCFVPCSARFQLTDAAREEGRAKSQEIGVLSAEDVDRIAGALLEATMANWAPSSPWHESLTEEAARDIARAMPSVVAQVLLRNIDKVESVHDFRGWLWQCFWSVGNRAGLRADRALAELEAEVVAHPEPDDPRVAYATAVQATDPDRAELIRVQVAILRSMRANEAARAGAELYERQRTLRTKHQQQWTKDVAALGWVKDPMLMRGFVEWVTVSARAFLDHAEQLYAVAPVLHVDFTDVKAHARELFASPLLARLHSLSFLRDGLGDDDVTLLAKSAYLGNLRWLDLSHNKIGVAGIEALAASSLLPSLRFVDLGNNPAPDPTPQVVESDPVRIETTSAGADLQKRFGPRPWLDAKAVAQVTYPPERGVF
jgi:uncharacterized protein (TIGR02996 family)